MASADGTGRENMRRWSPCSGLQVLWEDGGGQAQDMVRLLPVAQMSKGALPSAQWEALAGPHVCSGLTLTWF